ncbi:hypothetical protein AB1282_00300 [Gottfriedia sp. S16(2024)]|uniref:phage scaffolding protein n=1 Tax=Gottfriedia sp. S16(2024) TaxID=3162883 RepID=UPI003D1BA161
MSETNHEVNNEVNATNENQPEQTPKAFSQEDVDKIVADRIARERKKVEKFADYDELKTKLDAYEKEKEEIERSKLSEIELFKSDLEKTAGERDAFSNQIAELQSKIREQAITSEFIKVASSLNVQYVDDARKLADLSAVTVGEDGKVEGIEEIVKALVENKPFLVAQKQPQKLGEPTGGHKDTSDKTSDQLLEEARAKAQRTGRIEDKVAFAELKNKLGK